MEEADRAAAAEGEREADVETLPPSPPPAASAASPRSKRVSIDEQLALTGSTRAEDSLCLSPSTVSASPQWQLRTDAYFHRPSSVCRLGTNPAVIEFCEWVHGIHFGWKQVHDIFHEEDRNPAGGRYVDFGNQGMRGVTKKRWVKALMSKGYPNEFSLPTVFDEVAKEAGGIKKAPLLDLAEAPPEEEVTLPQLKRFERRLLAVSAALSADDGQSPTALFARFLHKKFGSTLRAWRAKLDVHGTGRIAFADFTLACRNLGVPAQAKLVWSNVRQERGARLEIHDLDPKEGTNMEEFAEVLWNTMGFDLQKAWLFLDPHHRKVITAEDFCRGARRLGFDGDARLLFKGLDSTGLGRLKHEDFLYLGRVSRVGHSKLGNLGQTTQGVCELIAWVQRELGGAHELIIKLGLGGGCPNILVGDLAARIQALGFEGDALAAASRAARGEGGTVVSAEALYSLLTGGRPRLATKPRQPASPPTRHRPVAVADREWCDGLDNISALNAGQSKYTRSYFAPPSRSGKVAGGYTAQSLGLSPRAVNIFREEVYVPDGRPAWDDNVTTPRNEGVSQYARSYFSDAKERPVRDRQRALVAVNLGGRGQGYW